MMGTTDGSFGGGVSVIMASSAFRFFDVEGVELAAGRVNGVAGADMLAGESIVIGDGALCCIGETPKAGVQLALTSAPRCAFSRA